MTLPSSPGNATLFARIFMREARDDRGHRRTDHEGTDGERLFFTATAEREIVRGMEKKLLYIEVDFGTERKPACESSDKDNAALPLARKSLAT